ncbi:MAG: lipoprotein [Candidatus Izemoplasma sp.]
MKKILLVVLLVVFLSGCSILDRGNYDKDRTGYIVSGNLITGYHTNSIGVLDVFQIDQIMTFFEALEYTSFDMTNLDEEVILNSAVTTEELESCGITEIDSIPRFIRIGNDTYFYNVRDNGYCTFDQYEFNRYGYTDLETYDIMTTSPIENMNTTLFKNADFYVNTFETIIFVETIAYNFFYEVWEKYIVSSLPMSLKQSGNLFSDNSDFFNEVAAIERYVLTNQSINLLELKEDYLDEEVNNIWSDDTVDALGRDHEIIKDVRLKIVGDILDIINDTLSRLGMFN